MDKDFHSVLRMSSNSNGVAIWSLLLLVTLVYDNEAVQCVLLRGRRRMMMRRSSTGRTIDVVVMRPYIISISKQFAAELTWTAASL